MNQNTFNPIPVEIGKTLHGLVLERVKRSPNTTAYKFYDRNSGTWRNLSWSEFDQKITIIHSALMNENLAPGDRVGIMMPNCVEWAEFEQASLRAGLVVVPLFPNDRPDNASHIVNESNIRLLLSYDDCQFKTLNAAAIDFDHKLKIVSVEPIIESTSENIECLQLKDWLPNEANPESLSIAHPEPQELATIVYTSGTTGRPKGVMLSHSNILNNAFSGVSAVDVYEEDIFLSFLPLSHTLERTVGYYIPIMCGSTVAFSRSIPELAEDLLQIRPTVLISVPRIFERVYAKIQTGLTEKGGVARFLFKTAVSIGYQKFEASQGRGRSSLKLLLWPILDKLVASKIRTKLGSRLRFAISGGAPLSKPIAETFIGLGVPILQGYGLTETSPVISVNTFKSNIPHSIGSPLPGVEVRLSPENELQTRSACVMLGYWKQEQATRETFTEDGWLKTGDLARIENNHIYITGRLKEILVLSNGEKVPPVEVEMAITLDNLFDQALVIGEGRPYLTCIIQINPDEWENFCVANGLDKDDADILTRDSVTSLILKRINECMSAFPGYAQIRCVTLTLDIWTDENGLLTPSLKMRRKPLMDMFSSEIEKMYAGH